MLKIKSYLPVVLHSLLLNNLYVSIFHFYTPFIYLFIFFLPSQGDNSNNSKKNELGFHKTTCRLSLRPTKETH